MTDTSLSIPFSDLNDIRIAELGIAVGLSSLIWTTVLQQHVLRIVFMGPLEQMRPVATRGVIASVADEQRVGIFAMLENISDAARLKAVPFPAAYSHDGVSLPYFPRPAFVRTSNVNVLPETGDVCRSERRKWSNRYGHVSPSRGLMCLAVAGVLAPATVLHCNTISNKTQENLWKP